MSYAKEILEDAENWITIKQFKTFWEKNGIYLGLGKIQQTAAELSKLSNSRDYIRVFGSIKNRKIHRLRVLDYILEKDPRN